MSKIDINNHPYDEATMLKLNLFRKCFREWFPVFIHNNMVNKIYIYDMFAGSGQDSNGNSGSPMILLEESKGDTYQYCKFLNLNRDKSVTFGFNEKLHDKRESLEICIKKHFELCRNNCHHSSCVYSQKVFCTSQNFMEIEKNSKFNEILKNQKYAKFILLDQYGFSQITDNVFLKLVNSPLTDFIFFISSSFIKRFKEHPNTTKYLNTTKMHFEETKPKECHRIIANYFRSLIDSQKEYYVNHFTIQKGSNYYGLIFGTSHSLGMEKFVKVCWEEDKLSGESNCNINDDYESNTLFYNPNDSSRKNLVKKELIDLILNRKITSNVDGLKWVLSQGCEPKLFVETILELSNSKKIKINGKLNKKASNIHKVDTYKIIVE